MWVCGRSSHSSWIICTCAHLLILYIRTQRSEQVLEDWMMHKLCERMKRALGKTSVCMCVCQGSALTTVLNVSLCPNPTLLAPCQRRENKGTSHCLIYLYPPPSPSHQHSSLYQPRADTKNNHIAEQQRKEAPLSLSARYFVCPQFTEASCSQSLFYLFFQMVG